MEWGINTMAENPWHTHGKEHLRVKEVEAASLIHQRLGKVCGPENGINDELETLGL